MEGTSVPLQVLRDLWVVRWGETPPAFGEYLSLGDARDVFLPLWDAGLLEWRHPLCAGNMRAYWRQGREEPCSGKQASK